MSRPSATTLRATHKFVGLFMSVQYALRFSQAASSDSMPALMSTKKITSAAGLCYFQSVIIMVDQNIVSGVHQIEQRHTVCFLWQLGSQHKCCHVYYHVMYVLSVVVRRRLQNGVLFHN